jgi:hypothetical protein
MGPADPRYRVAAQVAGTPLIPTPHSRCTPQAPCSSYGGHRTYHTTHHPMFATTHGHPSIPGLEVIARGGTTPQPRGQSVDSHGSAGQGDVPNSVKIGPGPMGQYYILQVCNSRKSSPTQLIAHHHPISRSPGVVCRSPVLHGGAIVVPCHPPCSTGDPEHNPALSARRPPHPRPHSSAR